MPAQAGFNPRGRAAPRPRSPSPSPLPARALLGRAAETGACWLPHHERGLPHPTSRSPPPHPQLSAMDTLGYLSPVALIVMVASPGGRRRVPLRGSPEPGPGEPHASQRAGGKSHRASSSARQRPGTLGHRVGWCVEGTASPGSWRWGAAMLPVAPGALRDTPRVTNRAMAESSGHGGEGGELKP